VLSLVTRRSWTVANQDSRNGEELPRAYIVPQTPEKGTPETAENIKKWLAERVSKHKRLEGGVHFIEAVPKNPSGKILRKQLREQAALESTKAKL
jgi:4-coumarate--CoA ligase